MTAPSSLIIFDTETTGLIDNSAIPLKAQPQIIELYASKLRVDNLEVIENFHSLFYVKEVPAEVVKITSITTDMVRNAPKFAQMLPQIADFFLGVRFVVGHNLSYDLDMLEMELKRQAAVSRFPWPPERICTVEATEHLEGFRLGLKVLHERLHEGEGFDSAHRAQADVEATARCLRKLVEQKVIRL